MTELINLRKIIHYGILPSNKIWHKIIIYVYLFPTDHNTVIFIINIFFFRIQYIFHISLNICLI